MLIFQGFNGILGVRLSENKLSEYLLCIVVSGFYRSRCRSGIVGGLVNCVRIWYNLDENGIFKLAWEWNTSPSWVKISAEKQCKHTPDLAIIGIMAQKSPILSIGLGYKNTVFITLLQTRQKHG